MNTTAILDMIQSPDIRIRCHAVVVNDELQGILVPSVVIAELEAKGRLLIRGPKCTIEADSADPQEVWRAMLSSGAILFGSPTDIAGVDGLLADPACRHMATWLCGIAHDCRAVVDALGRVRSASVVVLGAGGTGSLLAMALAGAGVGKMFVVDRAQVEAVGLDRQFLFAPVDIGRDKAHVVCERVAARHPGAQVTGLLEDVDPGALHRLLDDVDVLALAVGCQPDFVAQASRVAARSSVRVVVCAGATEGAIGGLEPPNDGGAVVADVLEWMRLPQAISEHNGAATLTLAGLASSAVLAHLCGIAGAGVTGSLQPASDFASLGGQA